MSVCNVTLNDDRTVSIDNSCFGTEYENKATVLKFLFPATINEHEISSFSKYIEFKENTNKKPEEDKAIFYDLLSINDEYVLTSAITFYNSINVQIVLKKVIDEATGEMIVWKSKIFTINFCDGINASDIIDPEDPRIDLIDTLVKEATEVSEIVKALNITITDAEINRQASEEIRKANEIERQANESTRQTNENARNLFENYDATKLYVLNNKVAYEGSSYVCIKNLIEAGILPTNEEYWLLIAKKGKDAVIENVTASDVTFDNSSSNFSSTDMQGVAEEISTAIEELNTALDGVEILLASI